MTTDQVLQIREAFRGRNGRNPTPTEIASILANRLNQSVDVCDIEDLLQTASEAGLISLNEVDE